MENTRGLYAVMSMKNTPVSKDSSYWEDRNDIIYHLDRYSRQVEWLTKDLGAKIIYSNDFIKADVVWRESGEPAHELEKLIDNDVISTSELHGRIHGKFKLCDETMACIDTELRDAYRRYRVLKNCLKENSEEPIASIVALGKEVGDKANEFFNQYSEYLALDDIKRWYSDCKISNEQATLNRDLLEEDDKMPLSYIFLGLKDKVRYREPMRENIVAAVSLLTGTSDVTMEIMKMYDVLAILLEDPVICIKSEEEVTVQPLAKVREIRKNLSLFQRLYRKVLG